MATCMASEDVYSSTSMLIHWSHWPPSIRLPYTIRRITPHECIDPRTLRRLVFFANSVLRRWLLQKLCTWVADDAWDRFRDVIYSFQGDVGCSGRGQRWRRLQGSRKTDQFTPLMAMATINSPCSDLAKQVAVATPTRGRCLSHQKDRTSCYTHSHTQTRTHLHDGQDLWKRFCCSTHFTIVTLWHQNAAVEQA